MGRWNAASMDRFSTSCNDAHLSFGLLIRDDNLTVKLRTLVETICNTHNTLLGIQKIRTSARGGVCRVKWRGVHGTGVSPAKRAYCVERCRAT
jgi:hypothetical protein